MRSLVLFLGLMGALSTMTHAGFYLGTKAGLAMGENKITINTDGFPPDRFQTKNGLHSGIFGLYMGATIDCEMLFAGLEFGGQYDTLRGKVFRFTEVFNKVEQLKLNHQEQYDGALIVGFVTPSKVKVFVKVGSAYTRWNFKYIGVDGATVPGSPFAFQTKNNKGTFVLLTGFGIQAPISKSFSVRVEATYVPDVRQNLNIPSIPVANLPLESSSIKAQQNQGAVALGVAYHLGGTGV